MTGRRGVRSTQARPGARPGSESAVGLGKSSVPSAQQIVCPGPTPAAGIWNLGTLWNHIWFNDIMKCHYDIIVSWYHSFMISWFGEFGYHSRVILDIIYAFIYIKSLYDFTISLNHVWYHSYEMRYDFMIMISLYDVKAMISYIDFIISLNHDMKSYLKTCIEIIVMK